MEQTVSRFLPNVLTYQALEEMGIVRARSWRRSSRTRSVWRCSGSTTSSTTTAVGAGGVSDESDTYLTAYVLQGMLEAHRAGFTVDDDVVDERGRSFLRENLPTLPRQASSWQANRLAYQLYVLGEYLDLIDGAKPAGELGRAIKLFDQRAKLDQYGQGDVGRGAGPAGAGGGSPRQDADVGPRRAMS